MKSSYIIKFSIKFLIVHLFFFNSATFSQSSEIKNVQGTWKGDLHFNNSKLRVIFHINLNENQNSYGTMDSPDQNSYGILINSIICDNDSIYIDMSSINGLFKGKANKDLTQINGYWRQSGIMLPLILSKDSDKK